MKNFLGNSEAFRVLASANAAIIMATAAEAATYTVAPLPSNQGPGFGDPVPTITGSSEVSAADSDVISGTNYTVTRTYDMSAGPGRLRAAATNRGAGTMPTSSVNFIRSSMETNDLIFTSTSVGPTLSDVTLHLNFDGMLQSTANNSFSGGDAEVVLNVTLAGQSQSGSAYFHSNGTFSSSGILSSTAGTAINESLALTFTNVPANSATTLLVSLDALTEGFASGSSTENKALFGNTLTLNTAGDVFTSTDGDFTTADSPDFNLSGNNYTIPEPSTVSLFLGALGHALFRRKRTARA